MSKALGIKEVKEKACRFCAFRERSPQEVLDKIISWGVSEEDAHKLVAGLIQQNFINEQRFANAYCHDKFEFNSWGKQKIKFMIHSHRISEKIVQDALDRIDTVKYEERVYELAQRKWEKLKDEEKNRRKQKIMNYLVNKGYEIGLVWKVIDSLERTKSQQ